MVFSPVSSHLPQFLHIQSIPLNYLHIFVPSHSYLLFSLHLLLLSCLFFPPPSFSLIFLHFPHFRHHFHIFSPPSCTSSLLCPPPLCHLTLPLIKVRMVLSVYQRWWGSGDSFVLNEGENSKQPQERIAQPPVPSSLHPSSRRSINRSFSLTTLLIRCTNNIFHLLIMRQSLPGISLSPFSWPRPSPHIPAPSTLRSLLHPSNFLVLKLKSLW